MRLSLPLVVLAAAGLAGCGEDEAPVPTATLGTGQNDFEALANGGDIFIVQGPQNGYHFFGSVRVTGIIPGNPESLTEPTNPTTRFSILRNGQAIDRGIAQYTQGLDPVTGEAGTHEMVGRLVILDINDDSELDGVTVRFEVEVTGTDGTVATDGLHVVGVPHPNNR